MRHSPTVPIDLWHDLPLRFGHLGRPQRWINVLGRVAVSGDDVRLWAHLNGGPARAISLGPNGTRLAAAGDFNIELDPAELLAGRNELRLEVSAFGGWGGSLVVPVEWTPERSWPLPFAADFRRLIRLDEAAQAVDGEWQLTSSGVRVREPYYDRVLALGDMSWRDYEIEAVAIFHGLREPVPGRDQGAGVVHAALALRWPGHTDDGIQPRVRWHPLGVTCEFRRIDGAMRFGWRMLDPGETLPVAAKAQTIAWDIPYRMKARVTTVGPSASRYCCKCWRADSPEPAEWDLELVKQPETVAAGGALLIAHYTDVTFVTVEARPIGTG